MKILILPDPSAADLELRQYYQTVHPDGQEVTPG
jgi:hypothetical protein